MAERERRAHKSLRAMENFCRVRKRKEAFEESKEEMGEESKEKKGKREEGREGEALLLPHTHSCAWGEEEKKRRER